MAAAATPAELEDIAALLRLLRGGSAPLKALLSAARAEQQEDANPAKGATAPQRKQKPAVGRSNGRRVGLLMNFGGFCTLILEHPQPPSSHSPKNLPPPPHPPLTSDLGPSARIPGFPGTARCDYRDFLTIVACCVNL